MPVRKSLYQIPLVAVSYLAVYWVVFQLLYLLQPGIVTGWSWMPMLLRTGLVYLFSFPLFLLFGWVDRHLRGRLTSITRRHSTRSRSRLGNQFRNES